MLKGVFSFIPRPMFWNETIKVSHGTGLFQCCCTNSTFDRAHGETISICKVCYSILHCVTIELYYSARGV